MNTQGLTCVQNLEQSGVIEKERWIKCKKKFEMKEMLEKVRFKFMNYDSQVALWKWNGAQI